MIEQTKITDSFALTWSIFAGPLTYFGLIDFHKFSYVCVFKVAKSNACTYRTLFHNIQWDSLCTMVTGALWSLNGQPVVLRWISKIFVPPLWPTGAASAIATKGTV